MYIFVWHKTDCEMRVEGGRVVVMGVVVVMMTCLMVWSIGTKENTSKNDRCKSGAAVGVSSTGAAEEMKNGSKSPTE